MCVARVPSRIQGVTLRVCQAARSPAWIYSLCGRGTSNKPRTRQASGSWCYIASRLDPSMCPLSSEGSTGLACPPNLAEEKPVSRLISCSLSRVSTQNNFARQHPRNKERKVNSMVIQGRSLVFPINTVLAHQTGDRTARPRASGPGSKGLGWTEPTALRPHCPFPSAQ